MAGPATLDKVEFVVSKIELFCIRSVRHINSFGQSLPQAIETAGLLLLKVGLHMRASATAWNGIATSIPKTRSLNVIADVLK